MTTDARATVFLIIDARIAEVVAAGLATDDPGDGWDLGIEAASLKEIRSKIAAALDVPPTMMDLLRRGQLVALDESILEWDRCSDCDQRRYRTAAHGWLHDASDQWDCDGEVPA